MFSVPPVLEEPELVVPVADEKPYADRLTVTVAAAVSVCLRTEADLPPCPSQRTYMLPPSRPPDLRLGARPLRSPPEVAIRIPTRPSDFRVVWQAPILTYDSGSQNINGTRQRA
jgi:hypothetical protein